MAVECAAKLSNWLEGSSSHSPIRQVFFPQEGSNSHDWDGYCHIGQIGEKVKLLLRHKQQGLEPLTLTSMNQGVINASLMGIELATIGQVVVALAN